MNTDQQQPVSSRELIWDLPIRVFHWGFALSTGGALVLALTTDEDSRFFAWHMLLGLSACFFLVARIVLAVVGNRHNRWSALFFPPLETARYMVGALTGRARHYSAHNPGSALVTLLMFILVTLLVWTGVRGEAGEDMHASLAYALLALVVGHLAGLALHTLRHRELIALSMFDGRKQATPGSGLRSARRLAGWAMTAVSAVWVFQLFAHYDPVRGTVKLPATNVTLTLGEGSDEADDDHSGSDHPREHDGEDDD